ncbi:MAG: DNA alkylation repair protein, partial [Planctomycetota bacterium JB042]
KSGRYEARLLAAFVDEPARVTSKQMDDWARDFDDWATVDTVCFHLFDRAPAAWKKPKTWAAARAEFKKRAAFALLWSLSVHDRDAPDDAFLAALPLIEAAARDDRNFVKKGVDMALRAIGKRNRALNAAAVALAARLGASDDVTARWIGRHAHRELTGAAVRKRLAGR